MPFRNNHLTRVQVSIEHLVLRLESRIFLHWTTAGPREIIKRRIVSVLVIDVRFIESLAISINDSVADSDPVAGHSNEALDQCFAEIGGVTKHEKCRHALGLDRAADAY